MKYFKDAQNVVFAYAADGSQDAYIKPGLTEITKDEATGLLKPLHTLEEAVNDAKQALRSKRKQIEYGGFEFQGQTWDSSEKDELRLNSMLKMFEMTGLEEFPGWKVAEGVYITATPEIIQGAAVALMTHYARAFAVEAEKLAEIEALETTEEVAAWLATELESGW